MVEPQEQPIEEIAQNPPVAAPTEPAPVAEAAVAPASAPMEPASVAEAAPAVVAEPPAAPAVESAAAAVAVAEPPAAPSAEVAERPPRPIPERPPQPTGREPINMKALLEAGVHFGHQTRRWNPTMKRYIFTQRNGIHIIDLQQTLGMINDAYKDMVELVANGGKVIVRGDQAAGPGRDPVRGGPLRYVVR